LVIMNENNSQEKERSVFFLGLVIGLVIGGIFILLLDKEERKTVLKNLKTDWKTILRKFSEIFEKEEKGEEKNPKIFPKETSALPDKETEKKNSPQSTKRFFKKSGRKLI